MFQLKPHNLNKATGNTNKLILYFGPVFVPALILSAYRTPSSKDGQINPSFYFSNSSGLKFMISATITASLSGSPLQIAEEIYSIAFGELYGSAT